MEQRVAFTRHKDRFFDFNMIDRLKSNFRKSGKNRFSESRFNLLLKNQLKIDITNSMVEESHQEIRNGKMLPAPKHSPLSPHRPGETIAGRGAVSVVPVAHTCISIHPTLVRKPLQHFPVTLGVRLLIPGVIHYKLWILFLFFLFSFHRVITSKLVMGSIKENRYWYDTLATVSIFRYPSKNPNHEFHIHKLVTYFDFWTSDCLGFFNIRPVSWLFSF